jgi:hypothetical protein
MDRKNINRGFKKLRVWQDAVCHDCHEGVVTPGIYINIYGETLKTDPKSLDPNTEVMRL